MKKVFYFSWKVSLVGIVLALGMLRLSYWQWERHGQKELYTAQLRDRLESAPLDLSGHYQAISAHPEQFLHRRVTVSGTYDFDHEVTIINRRSKDDSKVPGVLVLTPLKMDGSSEHILVNRGFLPLPLAARDKRSAFHRPTHHSFIGLVKTTVPRRWLAPHDPQTGRGLPWVDAFTRIEIAHIGQQLPYTLAPFYLEVMDAIPVAEVPDRIIQSSSNKEELLVLPLRGFQAGQSHNTEYPSPMFDTVVPAGRHLGYVFEWAIMAFATLLICFVLQLRPPRSQRNLQYSS